MCFHEPGNSKTGSIDFLFIISILVEILSSEIDKQPQKKLLYESVLLLTMQKVCCYCWKLKTKSTPGGWSQSAYFSSKSSTFAPPPFTVIFELSKKKTKFWKSCKKTKLHRSWNQLFLEQTLLVIYSAENLIIPGFWVYQFWPDFLGQLLSKARMDVWNGLWGP